jgi:hypothetical protein
MIDLVVSALVVAAVAAVVFVVVGVPLAAIALTIIRVLADRGIDNE